MPQRSTLQEIQEWWDKIVVPALAASGTEAAPAVRSASSKTTENGLRDVGTVTRAQVSSAEGSVATSTPESGRHVAVVCESCKGANTRSLAGLGGQDVSRNVQGVDHLGWRRDEEAMNAGTIAVRCEQHAAKELRGQR